MPTIIENILSRASGEEAKAGDKVWAEIDLTAMRDFGGPNVILAYEENFGKKKVHHPKKVAITFDLHIPARDMKVARNQQICRNFAEEQGAVLFDINHGIGQHTLLEHGFVKPGDVIVGTDSHMNLLGAVGAFASGVGTTDIVASMAYGKLWFRVPETYRFNLTGTAGKEVYPKDIILHIIKELGSEGLLYRAAEFYGPVVDAMGLSGRITLMSMITEMSGKIGFVPPDDNILKFVQERENLRAKREKRDPKNIEPVMADEDAEYAKELNYDVSELEPLTACPHSPDNVKPVADVQGTQIDQVFIGSCTNGRLEDLESAARILKGKKVKVRTIIVPATMEVAEQSLREGLYRIFFEAGAVVSNPSCALCTTGHPGILAPGETTVSTSNRNFPGKIGKEGKVYLTSPATAAASAVAGAIADPRDY